MARSQLTQNDRVASLIASVLRRLAELAIFDRHASWLAFRIGFVEQPDRRKAITLQGGEPSAQCRPPPTRGIPGHLVEHAPRVVESLLVQQLRGQLEALVVDLVLRGNHLRRTTETHVLLLSAQSCRACELEHPVGGFDANPAIGFHVAFRQKPSLCIEREDLD